MLGRINNAMNASVPTQPVGHERDELEDMKRAMELLYQFRKELGKLHFNCLDFIEAALQRRYYA